MTSIRTKQKIVAQEVLYEFPLPKDNQMIARVTDVNANNLHHVETEHGETFLVSMPTKFRNFIMIKRGSFLIIEPIVEGKKVKGEITSILYPEQIRYIDENGRCTSNRDSEAARHLKDDLKQWYAGLMTDKHPETPERFSDVVKKRNREETNYLDDDLLPPSSDEEEEFEDTEDDNESDLEDQEDNEKETDVKQSADNHVHF